MLIKIIIIVALLIAVLAVLISMQPANFSISRSTTINATAEKIFAEVNDLHKWNAWSPWAKLDPSAKNTFEGPVNGKGAKMSWIGNNQVGSGIMTITESTPYQLIQFQLDFLKPMKATNSAEFTFKADGDKTIVTWTMSGTSNFMGKAVSLIFNCEKMVGGQFEKGLADLKDLTENNGAK